MGVRSGPGEMWITGAGPQTGRVAVLLSYLDVGSLDIWP